MRTLVVDSPTKHGGKRREVGEVLTMEDREYASLTPQQKDCYKPATQAQAKDARLAKLRGDVQREEAALVAAKEATSKAKQNKASEIARLTAIVDGTESDEKLQAAALEYARQALTAASPEPSGPAEQGSGKKGNGK